MKVQERVVVARFQVLSLLACLGLAWAASAAEPLPKLKVYTVDVGTGLGVYMEVPRTGQPPVRIVYDTGKGAGKGLENDLVTFLTSPEVGLKPAQGGSEGGATRSSVAISTRAGRSACSGSTGP